jgi:hypothetical protein
LDRGLIKVGIEQDTMTRQVEAEIAGLDAKAVAAEQRKQGDAIRKLERGLIKVGIEQDVMARQVDHADTSLASRFGRIEDGLSALEQTVKSNVGNDAGNWSDAVGQLGVLAAHTRTDIYGLRSSLDEHVQAYRKEIATITTRLNAVEQASQSHRVDALAERLDRLEQLVSRDMTSSIQPPARKIVVKRKPRAKAKQAQTQPAYPPQIAYPQYPMQASGGLGGMQ